MKNVIILGCILLVAAAGAAFAGDKFPVSCSTAHNTGNAVSCKCPSGTYITGSSFTLNGNGVAVQMGLYCTAACLSPGSSTNGTEVVWPYTGQGATSQCDQNNLMTGFLFVNNSDVFKFTPYCTPVSGLTATSVAGNEATTHNTGDPGTSRCPDGSLARGMWGANFGSAFHFELICWKEG